jgi:hypothetical protein
MNGSFGGSNLRCLSDPVSHKVFVGACMWLVVGVLAGAIVSPGTENPGFTKSWGGAGLQISRPASRGEGLVPFLGLGRVKLSGSRDPFRREFSPFYLLGLTASCACFPLCEVEP